MTATAPIFAAVYAALVANPAIGAGVYDAVPQDAAYPHIEIDGGRAYDWSAALMRGEDIVVEIHVWSRYRGYKEARELMGKVKDRLHEVSLSVTGATLVDIRFQDSEIFTDADGVTRHGIIRFRALATVAS